MILGADGIVAKQLRGKTRREKDPIFFHMTCPRRMVGRLLMAMKAMNYLRQKQDFETLAKLERCFAPDWSYVRKTRKLDEILRSLSI